MTTLSIESVAPACLMPGTETCRGGGWYGRGSPKYRSQWADYQEFERWFESGRNALAITFASGGRIVTAKSALRLRHYKTKPATLQIINSTGTRRGNYCRLDPESVQTLQRFKVAEKGNKS